MRRVLALVLLVAIGGAVAAAVVVLRDGDAAAEECGSTTEGSPEGPALQPDDVCTSYEEQDGRQLNPALQDPDRFAWQLFVEINAPAGSGNEVFWETWADQHDLYVKNPDPDDPPQWPQAAAMPDRAPQPSVQQAVAGGTDPTHQCDNGGSLHEETRVNQATFEYVVANDLWYVEGQRAAFANEFVIDFPIAAREIKANWIPITEDQKPDFHWTSRLRDEAKPGSGTLFGLVAMHIISKDLPNWTWATFEHKDNPCYSKHLAAQDSFGVDAGNEPTPELLRLFEEAGLALEPWANYRLDGAQVDFTDSEGRPYLLGNSITELGFQTTASCMTCHARATIGPDTKSFSDGRLSVFDPDNVWAGQPQSFNGVPDPDWYWDFSQDPPARRFIQTDFLWSLAVASCATEEC